MTNNHPRVGGQLNTAEQLDALPAESVIRTSGFEHPDVVRFDPPRVAVKAVTGDWSVADEEGFSVETDELDDLPATVLYIPGEHPDTSTGDANAEALNVDDEARWPGIGEVTADPRGKWAAARAGLVGRTAPAEDVHGECGQPWTGHEDDGVQMLCPDPAEAAAPVKDVFGAAVQVITRHVPSEDTAISITSELNGKHLLAMASTTPAHGEIARAILLVRLAERGLPAEHVDDPDLLAAVKPMADAVLELYADQLETTTEWGVRNTATGGLYAADSEVQARDHVSALPPLAAVVRREVTAWTEADK